MSALALAILRFLAARQARTKAARSALPYQEENTPVMHLSG